MLYITEVYQRKVRDIFKRYTLSINFVQYVDIILYRDDEHSLNIFQKQNRDTTSKLQNS